MTKVIAMLLILATGSASAVVLEGKAAPTNESAVEGGACKDEGTLNDIQAASPLLCADGKWRKVVFKDAGDGSISPFFYEGRCSLRFEEGKETEGKILLKAGEIADVCLPTGWRAHVAATSNSYDWIYTNFHSMPNVVLLKSAKEAASAKLWIYPVNQTGKMAEKIVVEMRSSK